VLPLRFGTVLPDRSRAERLLRGSAADLAGELDRVRDHREWGLRVVPREQDEKAAGTQDEPVSRAPARDGGFEPSARAPAPGTTEPTGTAPGETGTSYLSARRDELRRAALREERLTGLTNRVHDELAMLATEAVTRSGRPGPGRLNAAYLVARAKEDDFLDAAEAAVRTLAEAGCEARVTGPWPPYSFVGLTLGEARDA
jgi:hypothetical protein